MAIDEKPNRSTGLTRDRREETSLVTSEPLDEKSLLVSSFFGGTWPTLLSHPVQT